MTADPLARLIERMPNWQAVKFVEVGLSDTEARELLPWCGGCDFRATGRWQWCAGSYDPQGERCLGLKISAALRARHSRGG